MKKIILVLALTIFVVNGFSQGNLVNISAGYSWANIDISEYVETESTIEATGWRINGTYDFKAVDSKIAYGVSIGYSNVSSEYNGVLDTTEFTVSTIPVYFAPKYIFGNEKINAFVKLAIGGQSTTLKKTSNIGEVKVNGFGFYGGAGGGLMFFLKENIFLNAEYEIAFLTNSYYNGEWLQSGLFGIGFKF